MLRQRWVPVLWAALAVAAGTPSGMQVASAGCPAGCTGTDGSILGAPDEDVCFYMGSCNPGVPPYCIPQPGWCRRDTCKECGVYSSGSAKQCQTQQACQDSSYSLCRNWCSSG
jgi:hypothetical protein